MEWNKNGKEKFLKTEIAVNKFGSVEVVLIYRLILCISVPKNQGSRVMLGWHCSLLCVSESNDFSDVISRL